MRGQPVVAVNRDDHQLLPFRPTLSRSARSFTVGSFMVLTPAVTTSEALARAAHARPTGMTSALVSVAAMAGLVPDKTCFLERRVVRWCPRTALG